MVIMLTGDFHSLSEPSNILGEVLLSTQNYTTITETLCCSLAYCADLLLSWKVVLQSPQPPLSCLLPAFCLRCGSDPVPTRLSTECLPKLSFNTGCKTLVRTVYAAYLHSMTNRQWGIIKCSCVLNSSDEALWKK